MRKLKSFLSKLIVPIILLSSCTKFQELSKPPDISPLREGFRTSAAIAYCTSIAASVFHDNAVPSNVVFVKGNSSEYSNCGLIYINVDASHPLPFNKNVGQVIIAGVWNGNSGVISIVLANLNLTLGSYKYYGMYTIPIMEREDKGDLLSVFATEDIIVGAGSDTILNLNLSKPQFDSEIERLNAPQPSDIYVAAKQNVWFIKTNQNTTYANINDDDVEINGGGQMAIAADNTAGVVYHAMIQTRYNYANCNGNPSDGFGLIQNLKVGTGVDLGTIYIRFHENCDGRAYVDFGTGKYIGSNGKNIQLNFE